ncbi:MAG: VCBS repeat-containing protein, partial [Bacteroidota bacterium]
MRYFAWALAALVCLGMWGCTDSAKRFSSLPASQTGIDFNNQITESDSFNVLSFTYIYNGAGVATADFNNDGKTDVFFSGNMVSSRL